MESATSSSGIHLSDWPCGGLNVPRSRSVDGFSDRHTAAFTMPDRAYYVTTDRGRDTPL
jgi:hypothetical protein